MSILDLIPTERMRTERQLGQRMIVAQQTNRFCMTNIADYFYTWFRLTDTESLSGKYLLIALGMQLGESHTKLKLISIDI